MLLRATLRCSTEMGRAQQKAHNFIGVHGQWKKVIAQLLSRVFALCVVQSRFFQELKKAGTALSLDFPDCDLYLHILTVVTEHFKCCSVIPKDSKLPVW